MIERKHITENIESLPDDALREVLDFMEFLEENRKREEEKRREGKDPLAEVIGICEGPSDWQRGMMGMSIAELIFVGTWAWLALANRKDSNHKRAVREYSKIKKEGYRIVTSGITCLTK